LTERLIAPGIFEPINFFLKVKHPWPIGSQAPGRSAAVALILFTRRGENRAARSPMADGFRRLNERPAAASAGFRLKNPDFPRNSIKI
jgi:hypothetical protein